MAATNTAIEADRVEKRKAAQETASSTRERERSADTETEIEA